MESLAVLHLPSPPPANIADTATVTLLFHERLIARLFADLLEAKGVVATIATNASEVAHDERVITEASLFSDLSAPQKTRCLVVGDSMTVGSLNAPTLVRPLTERKIASAIEDLLHR